ncbi:glycosyltransferase [Mycobacterium sp. TJFP1]
MIFVTVGSDLPFDRLIRHIDLWADATQRSDIFAQVGSAKYVPQTISYSEFLEPSDFNRHMAEADAVVAHAGMGTILSALQLQKPIIIFPRRTAFREIRNEHQLATARYLSASSNIFVALDEQALLDGLNKIDTLGASDKICDFASDQLIDCIQEFIATSG